MFDYGRLMFPRRRKGLHGTWLLYDESLLGNIKTVEEERAEASFLALEQERLRLRHGNEHGQQQSSRLQKLERIVPGWFHRNDKNADTNNVVREKLQEAERIVEQRGEGRVSENQSNEKHNQGKLMSSPSRQRNSHASKKIGGEKQRHPSIERWEEAEKRRLANSSQENVATSTRTIHNMHLFRNKTSCSSGLLATDISVTLVLQSTPERLWIMNHTCRRWKGPMILVLALTEEEQRKVADYMRIPERTQCPQLKVIVHILNSALGEDDSEMFPVNRLRNIGLDHVQTSHILMVDIDFVPSTDLATLIKSALSSRNALRERAFNTSIHLPPEEREAIVVPAFERISPVELCEGPKCADEGTKESQSELEIPDTFEALRSCVIDRKECRVFQSNNNWDGHSSTRSQAWLNSSWYEDGWENPTNRLLSGLPESTTRFGWIRILKCFDSVRYEPYVVLRWCPSVLGASADGPVAPFYDESFRGYGKNKIELISHLRVMGYSFAILPEGFIIHSPHSKSNAKKAWESTNDSRLHLDMDKLYPKFLKELVGMYKHEKHSIIKQC
jgi:Glycosyl-transferase for dystroglycan